MPHPNRHINIIIDIRKFVLPDGLMNVINFLCSLSAHIYSIFYQQKKRQKVSKITFDLFIFLSSPLDVLVQISLLIFSDKLRQVSE